MKKIIVKTEKEILRKAIPYGDEVIIINELSERQKLELINEMQKDLIVNKKIDERKFMLNIIDKCTNVKFDKNVFEVEEPTYEATIIIGEITLMFLEIVEEQKIYTDIQLKVNGNIKEIDAENEQEKVNTHVKVRGIEKIEVEQEIEVNKIENKIEELNEIEIEQEIEIKEIKEEEEIEEVIEEEVIEEIVEEVVKEVVEEEEVEGIGIELKIEEEVIKKDEEIEVKTIKYKKRHRRNI